MDSARELRDSAAELRALNNLGNFHCSRGQYQLALDYYQQVVAVALQATDLGAEAAAQHRLGYTLFQLGRYAESASHYERDLELHLRLEDVGSAARAHCNLGLALKQVRIPCPCVFGARGLSTAATSDSQGCTVLLVVHVWENCFSYTRLSSLTALVPVCCDAMSTFVFSLQGGELARALEHQASFLRLTIQMGHTEGRFKALGNLADVHRALGAAALSADMYRQQLALAESSGSERLRALAHENLAMLAAPGAGDAERAEDELAHREIALQLWRAAENCAVQECTALGLLARAQLRSGAREAAVANWKEQLEMARQLKLPALEGEACGGLGRALLAGGDLEVALGLF